MSTPMRCGRKESVSASEIGKQGLSPRPQSVVSLSATCTKPSDNGDVTPRPSEDPLFSTWQPMHEPAKCARLATSTPVSPVPASA